MRVKPVLEMGRMRNGLVVCWGRSFGIVDLWGDEEVCSRLMDLRILGAWMCAVQTNGGGTPRLEGQ